MITVRTANAADAALVADLSRETFYESFAQQNTPENMAKFMNEQFTREQLMQEVMTPGNIFLLAYDGEQAVGYARLRENNKPPELGNASTIEIARIYARTSVIGKGVGRALMEACMAIAEQKKVDTVWLGVWEHNQRAIDFYTRWGFTRFDTHVFQLGDDPQTDWLMKKELTDK